ncbi:MAG: RagB/SusD family nutrient uptake outer membrane protein [Muribaculaceae bacterium]|nr:RagB/SusD family nutrient uptake outer membrane protein [Muribaculaceae bacterium]
MKYNIILPAVASAMVILNSCDIEMVPKGMTTLDTTTELEYILNTATITDKPFHDISIIVNESYGDDYQTPVPRKALQSNTLMRAYLAYDESVDRASLAANDQRYNTTYNMINSMNVVIAKAPGCDGDEDHKKQIVAEARTMRAYYHFIIAAIYAQQYDDATAANNGGIAYVTDYNTSEKKIQLPLDQVYRCILDDLSDENLDLLPERNNVVRCSRYTGYAIKARVLLQMKHYSEALTYALKALEGNRTIEDRSSIKQTKKWVLRSTSPNNFIYISPMSTQSAVNYEQLSVETVALFEPGDLTKDFAKNNNAPLYNEAYGSGDSGVPGCVELTSYNVFTNVWGLTVERTMYNAAECYIRTGEIQKGLDMINEIRELRIDPDVYQPFAATTEAEAMKLLQDAKFIECLATYENFFDRKRWNSEDKYKATITRWLPVSQNPDECQFSIRPESPLWVIPFPVSVIANNDSFTQNY